MKSIYMVLDIRRKKTIKEPFDRECEARIVVLSDLLGREHDHFLAYITAPNIIDYPLNAGDVVQATLYSDTYLKQGFSWGQRIIVGEITNLTNQYTQLLFKNQIMRDIFKVINMTEPRSYKNQQGTMSNARDLTLQVLGGQWADKVVATFFYDGEAEVPFKTGDVVTASIDMFVNNYNGRNYQDNTIREIVRLKP